MVALATSALVVLLMVARRPESFARPQFWAEDGAIFFNQADHLGWRCLFIPYGGYLHFLLRVAASLASALDPLWVPAAYVAANAAALGGVALALFSPRLDLPRRPWLAFALVAVPQAGEVFNNLTNTQWITALGLVLLLLARDAERVGQSIFDGVVAVSVGLTGLYSTLFAPLFVVRALRRRTVSASVLAALVSLAGGVQLAVLIRSSEPLSSGGPFDPVALLTIVGRRLGAALLPTPWLGRPAWMPFVAGAGMALIATLAWIGWRRPERRETRAFLWGCLVVVFAATAWKFHGGRMLAVGNNGDRYFFLPKVLLLWLLILEWNLAGAWRWFVRSCTVLAVAAVVASFRFAPYRDYHWPAWAAKIRAHQPVAVPINPPGFGFFYPGTWR